MTVIRPLSFHFDKQQNALWESGYVGFVIGIVFLLVGAPLSGYAEDQEVTSYDMQIEVTRLNQYFQALPPQVVPATKNSISLYEKAQQEFQNQNLPAARKLAEQSLKEQAQNPLTLELLGDIDYYEQRLDKAQKNYETAHQLWPHASTQKKIEKLKREASVEGKMTEVYAGNFMIYYQRSQLTLDRYELKEMLKQAHRSIARDFSYYLDDPIVVVLYDEHDFRAVHDQPHWVGGIYDGKIRMPMTRGELSEERLTAISHHEITHAFVHVMSQGQAPAWINEGLAEYQERKYLPQSQQLLRDAFRSNALIPLSELLAADSVMKMNDVNKVSLFYEQSGDLVEFIIKKYRMIKIKLMLEEFGKGKKSEEVIDATLFKSVNQLEKEWHASLRNR